MGNTSLKMRMYILDDDLEIVARVPIGSITEPVFFDKTDFHRLFPSATARDDSPYIDIYVNSDGERTLAYYFCEHATPKQMRKFWDFARQRKTVDKITDRWASVAIVWGGPEAKSPDAQDDLMIYFDDDCAFAILTAICPESKTYADVMDDYCFLSRLFRASQRSRKTS